MDSRLTTSSPESPAVMTSSPRYLFPFHSTNGPVSGRTTSRPPGATLKSSRAAVASAIRTVWSRPFLYWPRTTGTLPDPGPGDTNETHAAAPSIAAMAICVRPRRPDGLPNAVARCGLRNCVLQSVAHFLQRQCDVVVPVGG